MPTPRSTRTSAVPGSWFVRASAVLVAAVIVIGGLVDGQAVNAAELDPAAASAAPPAPAGVAAPDLSDDMLVVPSTPVTRPHLHAEAAEVAAREADVADQTAADPGARSSASTAAVAVVHRVSVSIATVTATTADDAATPPDDASVTAAIRQLHDFWWEESGGTVDVQLGGIERTSLAAATCDPSAVLDSVHTTAFGGAFASYRWAGTDTHLLVLTRETCGSSAFATVGGGGGEIFSSVGTDTALGVPVLMHELGHNLGLGHAGAAMCRSTTSVDAPLPGYVHTADTDASVACPVEEYGDFLDIMGYSVSGARPHLSTPQRLRAGFQVDATTLREPGTRQQVTVGALDGAATTAGGRAVQVVDPLSGDTYWVEYRTASGRDASSAEFRGATPRCSSLDAKLVRCTLNGDRAVGEVRVLRAIPLSGSAVSTAVVAAGPVEAGDLTRRDTHLDAGESFTSTGGGFTVAVRSTSPSAGAVLDVALAGGSSTGAAPAGDTAGRPAPKQVAAVTTTALGTDRARQTWGTNPTAVLTATVAVAGGAAPAGSVTFVDGTTTLATVAVAAGGTATTRLPASLAPGAHSLSAAFTPSVADQAASTSAATKITVDKAATTTTLRLSAGSQVHGATSRITATASLTSVAGSAATGAGTVAFTVDGKVAARVAASGGRATWVVPAGTAAGAHKLTTTFTPSVSTALPSTSATSSFSVTKAASTTVLSPRSSLPKGKGANVAVSVTARGVAAPTGTITVRHGRTVVGTATLSAAAKGKMTVGVAGFRSAGSYPLTVTYSGNGSVGASTSAPVAFKVK
ncbi:hypothetical protein ES689_06970 [Frigoribacterium sp. ACAM 257]|uniref:Ig-like domain repeat protein n=1 Tax=Frigoribacterium sp. ACAM 257 TaxID=2508998 RepID=UPI0011B9DAA5|nr:Ig-like domain repeat protein [Frigoribacterium sp. ACAM 257]TWX38395.1 hypothetical protein ES689_06970 [Frigoribacterium sp. ACAM 257]